MAEPTQERIVSELRCRGTADIADIMHVFGPGFASIIPEEIKRMKDTGLLVYDEPLGPGSVLRLPHTT